MPLIGAGRQGRKGRQYIYSFPQGLPAAHKSDQKKEWGTPFLVEAGSGLSGGCMEDIPIRYLVEYSANNPHGIVCN